MTSPGTRAIRAEIDRLYGLPLDELTAARNALAARVRERIDQGRRALEALEQDLRELDP